MLLLVDTDGKIGLFMPGQDSRGFYKVVWTNSKSQLFKKYKIWLRISSADFLNILATSHEYPLTKSESKRLKNNEDMAASLTGDG